MANGCAVLHPQLKLKYFTQHGWTKKWVETAEEIVRDEFAKYNTEATTTVREHFDPVCYVDNCLSQTTPLVKSDTVDLLDIPMDDIADTNELDEYLAKPLEKVRDPIGWWWDHRACYPKLSKMAFDYLSIPRESSIITGTS